MRSAELLRFWAQAAWFWSGWGEGAGRPWTEGQPGKGPEKEEIWDKDRGKEGLHETQAWMAPSRHRTLGLTAQHPMALSTCALSVLGALDF